MDVHIRFVIKHIQRAGHIQVQCLRYPVRFRQVLVEQGLVQIGEDGHILRAGARQIGAVDGFHGTVYHGALNRFQTCFAAHDQLTERQHKIRFQGKRTIILGVVEVDVQRIHIVLAGGRKFDDLPMQPLDQRIILGFWV